MRWSSTRTFPQSLSQSRFVACHANWGVNYRFANGARHLLHLTATRLIVWTKTNIITAKLMRTVRWRKQRISEIPFLGKSFCELYGCVAIGWRRDSWWKQRTGSGNKRTIFFACCLSRLDSLGNLVVVYAGTRCWTMGTKRHEEILKQYSRDPPFGCRVVVWASGSRDDYLLKRRTIAELS